MAVAKPQVYRPRFTGAGGPFRTELGQALGNVARAFQRREDRQEAQRTAEEERKGRLLGLKARTKLYDYLEDARNNGTFDGRSAGDVSQEVEQEIERLARPLLQHDEVAAEEFRLASRSTLAQFTAGQRTREAQAAAAETLSVYGETELRFERDLPIALRNAMNARTPGEAEAAWGEVQALHRDATEAARSLQDVGQRNKALAQVEEKMNVFRFDAKVNHAVHTNTAVGTGGLFASIANGKDWIDGTDQQARWSEGISPEHVARRRREALVASRQQDEARIARIKMAKAQQEAENLQRRQEVLVQVDQGEMTQEQASQLLTMAGDPQGSDLIRDFALEKLEDTSSLQQITLDQAPSAQGYTQREMATISLSLEPEEIRQRMSEAILMNGAGRLSDAQKDTIMEQGRSQLAYIDEVEEAMGEEQKAILRDVKHAYRSIYEQAGLIGPTGFASLNPHPQIAFYSGMQPMVEEFLLQNGADAVQTRLVVEELLPMWWEMSKLAPPKRKTTRGDEEYQPHKFVSYEGGDLAAVQRTLKALAQSGLKVETDREWMRLALKPEVSAALEGAYDEQGRVMPGEAILALEESWGEDAKRMYETVILPSQMVRLSMMGHVPGIDAAANIDKWMKHWGHY